jgi:hypothetical protein
MWPSLWHRFATGAPLYIVTNVYHVDVEYSALHTELVMLSCKETFESIYCWLLWARLPWGGKLQYHWHFVCGNIEPIFFPLYIKPVLLDSVRISVPSLNFSANVMEDVS